MKPDLFEYMLAARTSEMLLLQSIYVVAYSKLIQLAV